MSKHFVVTLVQNPDFPDKCNVFVTMQRDGGVCWPSNTVEGKMEHKFLADNNENVSHPEGLLFYDEGLKKEVLCVMQTVFYPAGAYTEVNSVLLHKEENVWHFLSVFQSFRINNTVQAGHLQLANLKPAGQSTERLFFYFWEKNRTALGFFDMNPERLKMPRKESRSPFFWREAPLHDEAFFFFKHGTKLLPCGLLVAPRQPILKNAKEQPKRYFLDLQESKEHEPKHMAPYKIVSNLDVDSKLYNAATKAVELTVQVKESRTEAKDEKTIHVTFDPNQMPQYTIETKPETATVFTNAELDTKQSYHFKFPPHLALYGTNPQTREMEKIDTEHPIQLMLAINQLQHHKAYTCDANHGDIHALRLQSSGEYYLVSNNNPHCMLELNTRGKTTLFELPSNNEKVDVVQAIEQIGQTGVIISIGMDNSSDNSFFILSQDKDSEAFSTCTLWQVNWPKKTIGILDTLITTKRNSQVFMSHHTTNHWQEGHLKKMCICVLFEDYHFFTCTCVGHNASQQRAADCFGGSKAPFYAPWLKFIDSRGAENDQVPTKYMASLAGFA